MLVHTRGLTNQHQLGIGRPYTWYEPTTIAYTVLALNVVAAWSSWWVLTSSISGRIVHYWVFPVLIFSIWGIFFTLSAIFVRNRTYLYSAYALCAVGYIFFAAMSWSLVVLFLTILALIAAEKKIKK